MTTQAVHPLKAIPPELRLLAIGKDDDPSVIGGVTVGGPVSGGGNNRVLFIDGSGSLGSDARFTYSPCQMYIEANDVSTTCYIACGNIGAVEGGASGEVQAYSDVSTIKLVASSSESDGLLQLRFNPGGGKNGELGMADDSVGLYLIANDSIAFKADGTTFEVVDVLKINNTVSAEAQASGTHVVAINIGGVNYKLLAVAA